MKLPAAVVDYLVQLSTADHTFAYLSVTPEGQVHGWWGDLAHYGLANLSVGDAIDDHLFYLAGMLPLTTAHEVLPSVHMTEQLIIDTHLVQGPQAVWVLLFDSTAATQKQQRLQQKGNDLSLLRHQYNKLLQQCLAQSQPAVSPDPAPLEHFDNQQRDISLLLIKICDLTRYSQQTNPTVTLQVLNQYLAQITQTIVEEGGVINHVLGETSVALFGLLPSEQSPPQQALDAAKRILKINGSEIKNVPDVPGCLGIGGGITTGAATAGIVHHQNRASLNAIGAHIHQLNQLAGLICPNSLVIDRPTYQILPRSQPDFEVLEARPRALLPELYAWVGSTN